MRTPARGTTLLVGLGVAVIVAATMSTLSASIPNADGTISACIAKSARISPTGLLGPVVVLDRKGDLRAIDPSNGETCHNDELPLTFNVKGDQGDPGEPGMAGPQGPQGPAGPQGPPGAGGDSLWAIMRGDGSVASSKGVLIGPGTGRTGVGFYQVQFDRNVSTCAALVNGSTHTGPFPIIIVPYVPSISHSSNTQIGVAMFDLTGHTADTEFTLVVTC